MRGSCKRLKTSGIVLVFTALLIALLYSLGCTANQTRPHSATPATASLAPQVKSAAKTHVAETRVVPPARDGLEYYAVRRGDTLKKIARAHGITLRALMHANDITRYRSVRRGEDLAIPSWAKVVADTTKADKHADKLIQTALGYQGVRYRYGGMSSRGFDCSGFVSRMLQTQGIRSPHNAAALFGMGTPISKSDLKAGDLVFFKTTSRTRISHVGIALDEGRFIHASSGRGSVRIDTLLDGYYANRYAGARRVLHN